MNSIPHPQLNLRGHGFGINSDSSTDHLIAEISAALIPIISEIIRRSVDGTIPPFIVDYTNQRIIVGALAASTSNIGKFEVTGDIKAIGGGNGLILPTRNGAKFGRIILENPDSNGNIEISCDPL